MRNENLDRRRFLASMGIGTATILAGCSDQLDDEDETSTEDDNQTENTEGEESETLEEPEEYTPEDSDWVEDGELTVRPFVGVYDVYTANGGVGVDDANMLIAMNMMPSPVEDYEIGVHYTPFSEVDTEWVYRPIKNEYVGGGHRIEYSHTAGEWQVDTSRSRPHIFERNVEEHGELVDTIEVPSASAGLVSEDVTDPIFRSDPEYTWEEFQNASQGDPAFEWYYDEVAEQMPDLGVDYHPVIQDYLNTDPAPWYRTGIGTLVSDVSPHVPPYLVGIDADIPAREPGVLTFSLRNVDKAPDVDSDEVLAQTPQFYRTANALIGPNRLEVESGDDVLSDEWEYLRHTSAFDSEYDGFWAPEPIDYFHDERMYPNIETPVDGYPANGNWRINRNTNYSRFGTKLEELAEMSQEKNALTGYDEETLLDVRYGDHNSRIQNLWNVTYNVDEQKMAEGQEIAARFDADGNPEPYEQLAQHPSVQNNDTIHNVAEQIHQACMSAGAEHPADQIRFVADFVNYFPYFDSVSEVDDSDYNYEDPSVFMGTFGAQHPLWTLYHRTGDCQDFAVLINAILRQPQFDFDPTYAFTRDHGFTLEDVDVGHVASAIPLDEIGVEDFEEEALRFVDTEETGIPDGLTFEKEGREYAYLESVGSFPMGRMSPAWELILGIAPRRSDLSA